VIEIITLDSDEVATGFVGRRFEVLASAGNFARIMGLPEDTETYEGTIVRANRRSFVLETTRGKVKCTWGQLRKELT